MGTKHVQKIIPENLVALITENPKVATAMIMELREQNKEMLIVLEFLLGAQAIEGRYVQLAVDAMNKGRGEL